MNNYTIGMLVSILFGLGLFGITSMLFIGLNWRETMKVILGFVSCYVFMVLLFGILG